jgi:hypothetical protein
MKTRLFLVAFLLACLIVPATASAAGLTNGIYQVLPNGSTFVGTLTTTSFQVVDGEIHALGTLTGTLTNKKGVTQAVNAPVNFLINALNGTCTILTLHTGRIDIDLLGIHIDLSPIDLVITGGPGSVGGLLCGILNNLNVNTLVGFLNTVLASL